MVKLTAYEADGDAYTHELFIHVEDIKSCCKRLLVDPKNLPSSKMG